MRIAWWLYPAIGMTPRERMRRAKEATLVKIAWLLPRSIAYWCAIRVIAHATTGQYSGQIVPDLTAMDALKRWE